MSKQVVPKKDVKSEGRDDMSSAIDQKVRGRTDSATSGQVTAFERPRSDQEL